MIISEINVVPVKPNEGLIAFASCVIDESIYIGSIGVHQRLDGSGYRITYPSKSIGSKRLNYYHPITKEVGSTIEQAITRKCAEIFERSDEQNGRYNKISSTHP